MANLKQAQSLNILIVDDDYFSSHALKITINNAINIIDFPISANFKTVFNAWDCLEELRSKYLYYHFIFLDLCLPEMDGYSIIKEIDKTKLRKKQKINLFSED